jgi:hypothetical protein
MFFAIFVPAVGSPIRLTSNETSDPPVTSILYPSRGIPFRAIAGTNLALDAVVRSVNRRLRGIPTTPGCDLVI